MKDRMEGMNEQDRERERERDRREAEKERTNKCVMQRMKLPD